MASSCELSGTMKWIEEEAEDQFYLCRSANHRSSALANKGQMDMYLLLREKDWPLWIMMAQAELTFGTEKRLGLVMRMLKRKQRRPPGSAVRTSLRWLGLPALPGRSGGLLEV